LTCEPDPVSIGSPWACCSKALEVRDKDCRHGSGGRVLSSKYEALSSNPNTTKKAKQNKQNKHEQTLQGRVSKEDRWIREKETVVTQVLRVT
jgi:hypothetical protein